MKILLSMILVNFFLQPAFCKGNKTENILQDSISNRHLIPMEVLGWRGVFEVTKEDNHKERGIIVYHFILDQEGNIKDLRPVSKNVSDQVENAYRKKIKSTWRVIRFNGKNPPALSEGDYMLHVSP